MIKKISFGIIILVVAVIAYNLLNQIKEALNASERLSKIADDVYSLEAKNRGLKKKLSEIQSAEFIEEEARNKLGLAREVETVIIIPDEKIKEILGATSSAQEERLPNWLGWLRVFFK